MLKENTIPYKAHGIVPMLKNLKPVEHALSLQHLVLNNQEQTLTIQNNNLQAKLKAKEDAYQKLQGEMKDVQLENERLALLYKK